ncbi:MAG TPA: phosphohistidine phosphatase SixA [Candidatus Acidoferrum sp.]|nr:phosphohistidine phosphatase SixA [Candidatus Acidoferrum sp.]
MLLYIVRHGIAIDREDPKCPPDPERYLTEEGLKKTEEVAQGVAALGAKPNLFLSSPYVRAMQTAEIFASVFRYSKQKIRRSELLLPGSEVHLFYRDLAKYRSLEAVFCFGHAPHLDELLSAGLGVKKDLSQLKKAGVAVLELSRIFPPEGTLVWLAIPKLLRRAGK